jgi:hypothetical protein
MERQHFLQGGNLSFARMRRSQGEPWHLLTALIENQHYGNALK